MCTLANSLKRKLVEALPGESTFVLYRRAAELGDLKGAFFTGTFLLQGSDEHPADLREALKWLELAASLPSDIQEAAWGYLSHVRPLIAGAGGSSAAGGGGGDGGGGGGGGGTSGSLALQSAISAFRNSFTPLPQAYFDRAGDPDGQLKALLEALDIWIVDRMAGRAPPLLADDATGRLVRALFRRVMGPVAFFRGLLEEGANATAPMVTNVGALLSPLAKACLDEADGKDEASRVLVAQANKMSAFRIAAAYGNVAAIRAFVDFGCSTAAMCLSTDPYSRGDGFSPLHDAVSQMQFKSALLLLEAGASPLVRAGAGESSSALEMAVEAARGGGGSLATALADKGFRRATEGDDNAKNMLALLSRFVGPLALAEAEAAVASGAASPGSARGARGGGAPGGAPGAAGGAGAGAPRRR